MTDRVMAFSGQTLTSDAALFSVKIQNWSSQCLWDTGATINLISKRLVSCAKLQAATFKLAKPRVISGLGNATVFSTLGAKFKLQFRDQKPQSIECVVCDTVPHELILGLPFMKRHGIAFKPNKTGGFKLLDPVKNVVVASTNDVHTKPEVCVASAVAPNNGPEHRNDKQASLHPTIKEAFELKLGDKLTIDEVLTTLLRSGELLIDDGDLSDPDFFQEHKCHFASQALNAEEQLGQGAEAWELTPEQKVWLDKLLLDYDDIFASSASDVGKANFPPVRIRLLSKDPVALRNYRTPLQYRDWLKEELKHLKDAGIIEDSESPYNSPCLVVPKKLDVNQDVSGKDTTASKGARLVVDYRQVNSVLEDANFPIPRIQDLLLDMKGNKVFSAMDIRHAFYTIELHPESRIVTAFSCEFGKFQFKFLPQGLKISPAVFQQKISTALGPYEHSNPYMDDIFTRSLDLEPHFKDLEECFAAIRKYDFKLKKGKCLFFMKRILAVGHMLSQDGVSIDPEKLKDVLKLTAPKTVAEVRALLGFTNFLRDHVEHYADVAAPIQELVVIGKGKASFDVTPHWNEKCELSLKTMKEMLLSNQVLAFPDNHKPYELFTDASGKHMSGVLMQDARPIGYFAKSFHGTQLQWAALTKEAHAVYRAVEFFSVFITACKVTLRCDHKPLAKFLKGDTRNQMVNRWSLNMQQYDITFEWVATDKNISDCLSRLIDTGLYSPHEGVADDFAPWPKNQAEVLAALDIRTIDLPRAFQQEDMLTLQRDNKYCQQVLKLMEHEGEIHDQFQVKSGLLYKVVRNDGTPVSLALVIPPKLGLTAIVSVHLELLHPGENKMVEALRRRVYWRGMNRQIKRYVAGCSVCQLKNLKADSYPFKHSDPEKSGPWVRLAVDIAGSGFGPSKRGNVAVLTAMCMHSQYPFAIPIPDKTSQSVINALTTILNQVNVCRKVLSDNGPEFTAKDFQKFLKAQDIKHEVTAPYSPQSNGVLERWHRFMNTVVRLCEPVRQDNEWELAVEAALKAYRVLPHAASGETPHFLAYHQDPALNLDKLLPTLRRSFCEPDKADKVLSQLKVAFGLARKNVCLARLKNTNKSASVPSQALKVGDLVTIKDNAATKGQSPWKIGYRIVEFCSDRTLRVESTSHGKRYRVNINHVKRTEPLAILLDNSQIDLFPGSSKLYLPAESLPDLNWPEAHTGTQLDDLTYAKCIEAVRDRSSDKGEQVVVEDPDEKDATRDTLRDETSQPDNDDTDKHAGVKPRRKTRQKTTNDNLTVRTRSGRVSKPNQNLDYVYVSAALAKADKTTPDSLKALLRSCMN